MLSISNLSYYIGDRVLYKDAGLHINAGDKIGLIGLNGTGKSTLLKLITKEFNPSEGTISASKGASIGFLNQEKLSENSNLKIRDFAMEAFSEALSVHQKIEEKVHQMEESYKYKMVDQLAKLQERYEALDGYRIQSKAEEVLEGIGFSTIDLDRPLNEFSGGWRMRVILAKLLLEQPDFLLLDEPTNHLDLPSIEWLEEYLRQYEGAVVIVSHDRQFLNNTITRIAEISQQKIFVYEGNYDFYLKEKALRVEIQQNAYQNQQQKIKQTERFINRFRAKASKARQVQSKVKSLDRLDVVDEVVNTDAEINIRFTFGKKPGRFVSKLIDISKAFGDNLLFENTSLNIERGDKIAIIGANGKGKSTLLRIINGTESFEGKREAGYNVISTFYAQHQIDSLHLKNEMLAELAQAGSKKTEQQLRSVLGCFLFSGDDVYKKIKVLSGGEKSRVALAKTLISEANFMLLDEPTNHLDILSENILLQALQQFEGTMVMVSHNRYFISKLANKIWYFDNLKIKEYPGTYEEYVYWKDNIKEKDKAPVSEVLKKNKMVKSRFQKKDNSLKNKLQKIEIQIETLELKKENLEIEMAKPEVYSNHERLSEINQEYSIVDSKLTELNEYWDGLISQIDSDAS